MPLWATRMPLNQIDSRSRSAGSPALPTAMTTRPQLASSPAIAVLTSGELAIDVAGDLLGEILEHALERGAKRAQPRVGGARDLRRTARRGAAGREGEQGV